MLVLALTSCAPSEPLPRSEPAESVRPPERPAGPRAPIEPARPIAPRPSAPVEAGVTALEGVDCLAPARLSLIRFGDDVALPAAFGPIAGPFAVLEGRTALVLAGGRLVEATTGAALTLARDGEAEPVVAALARRPTGLLVVVVGRDLSLRTPDGLAPLVPLPGDGWQVACGPGAVYVYDPTVVPGPVHVIDDALRTAKLIELPYGVTAVCATTDGVAVATPGAVWSLRPGSAPTAALMLPKFRPVGLAHDPRTGTLFASDGRRVLAVVDGVPLPLVEGLGGALAWVDEGDGTALWILDPARRVLARVAPLDWIGH